jgi:uncharacterized protein
VLVKAVLSIVALWAALVVALALMQGAILFPRAMVGAAPELPGTTQRLRLLRPDGVELHGVLIPGPNPNRPVLLGFGGNAWNAESMALFIHQNMPEYSVAAFHYRGYSPSSGRPSSAALLTDAEAIFDWLYAGGMTEQIAIGFSIGSGIAAHLAATRPLRGAVLVTPFDSLGAVARQNLPWAPVTLFFRNEMNTLAALENNTLPLALILATRDEVIGPARAEALVTALQSGQHPPVLIARIDAGHNDIYAHKEFGPTLRAALGALQGGPPN